jgi:hypothetical protein
MPSFNNLPKANKMKPYKQELFDKFIKDNWLSPGEIYAMMIYHCNNRNDDYTIETAVAVGEFYAAKQSDKGE